MLVHGQLVLGLVYIDVVEVKHDEPAVIVQRIIGTRRKLPAETDNGEFILQGLVPLTNPLDPFPGRTSLDTLQCLRQRDMYRTLWVPNAFEYRDVHRG